MEKKKTLIKVGIFQAAKRFLIVNLQIEGRIRD